MALVTALKVFTTGASAVEPDLGDVAQTAQLLADVIVAGGVLEVQQMFDKPKYPGQPEKINPTMAHPTLD